MNAPLYTTEILRLAASLKEPCRLEHEDAVVRLRSSTCGSRIETVVQLDSELRLHALSQQVLACAFGQASAALLELGATGRSRNDVATALAELCEWLEGSDRVPSWPRIEALEPARSRRSRHDSILLPFRALLAAMDAACRG